MSDKLLSLVKISLLLVICFSGKSLFAENFYKGKVIRFVVGYSPGGGFDTYTRVVARHIAKHIAGNPTTVVENRPGAGSLIAANYIYNRAKPDGLTVGIWNSLIVLRQALDDTAVKLDARRLRWIGTPSRDTPTCAIMGFTGLRTLKDILSSNRPIKMGGGRAGNVTADLPKILNKTLGTKFVVIPGYSGSAKIRLAMQAREVEGFCLTWEAIRTTARSILDAKGGDRLIPFIIHRSWDDPEVKDLPLFSEVIKGADNLATYNTWAAPIAGMMRPFSAPPGTSAERVNILRKAFKATMEDSEFLAETRKSKLTISYVSPEEIETIVARMLSMPPKAKENLKFLVRKKKKTR